MYLDCGYGSSIGSRSWCVPYKTFKKIYEFDPRTVFIERERVLGAEAALWSEMNNEYFIHTRIWPRVSSLAERLWNVEEKLTDP